MVSIRGTAEEMQGEWTVRRYVDELVRQRAEGGTRAPVRSAAQVPHDFAAEAAWVRARAGADPRLRIS